MANRIKDLRKSRGWTQEALAEKTGYSVVYISQLERGHRAINQRVIDRIAPALEVPASQLIDGDETLPDDVNIHIRVIMGMEQADRDKVFDYARTLNKARLAS